jgi:DNA repair protein RecO (recombination protein O)
MERHLSTEAIVINKKKIRESDLLITLLTKDKGKLVCLAKGAQSIKSTRLSHLQIGNNIKCHLYTKDNYYWLTETTTTLSFLNIQKNLTQINLLFYCLETLNHLIAENQQIDGVYEITKSIIIAINKNNLINYIQNEINLIKILGFGVTPEISDAFEKQDYKTTQKQIQKYLESIIEHPIYSKKLFS